MNDQLRAQLEAAKRGFNETQLRDALDAVVDPEGWKMPIAATIPADSELTRLQIQTAIEWFCGGGAEFSDNDDRSYIVTAPGYYVLIGA